MHKLINTKSLDLMSSFRLCHPIWVSDFVIFFLYDDVTLNSSYVDFSIFFKMI